MIGRALGRSKTRVVYVPGWFIRWCAGVLAEAVMQLRRRPASFNLDKVREATAGSWICSAETIRDELGFEPAAGLDQRLRETAEWYRREGWL